MLGLLAPTFVAILAAWALGGSLRGLTDLRIRGWPVVCAAFGLELLLYNPPIDRQPWALEIGPWLWLATKLMLLGVVFLNLRDEWSWPWLFIGVGLALNTVTIAANGGYMPQSPEAAFSVWGYKPLDPTRLHNVVPIGPDTRLVWLADVIPQPSWIPRPNVISIGDAILSIALAALLFVTVGPTKRFPGISWNRAPFHGEARS